ncbi:MAG: PLP-dependent cysteine synthase family protein, partial [Rhodothermia bacterium]
MRGFFMRHPEIINAIGGTPLLPIERLASHVPDGVTVLAKAEFMNPGGSVKDRPAWAMIREGLKSGQLNAQTTLLDATSGNTGIAYAMIGAAVGFRVHLAIPENASRPRQRLLEALGAELFLTDPVEGTDGAQMHVRRLIERNRDRYFYPDQYNNDANWLSHFETTGAEIIEQTEGKVTHFVAALGTTGTLIGVSRRLKQDLTNA